MAKAFSFRKVTLDRGIYWRAQRLWSGSYFAGSVGRAPLSIVRQYIEQQNRPVQGTARPLADLPERP